MTRPHPSAPLFPYTTLFRSKGGDVVLESRLAGWIARNERLDGTRVWIACDEDVRAARVAVRDRLAPGEALEVDRKSTRLNSSHLVISYAVFCLKKKTHTDNT